MRMVCATIFLLVALVSPVAVASAAAQSAAGVAPTRIPIAGALQTDTGEPRTGSVLLVLSLYDGQDDPAPRWIEQQLVTLDAAGRYDVQFGATLEGGLPADLFSGTPAAQWVGVAVENEAEQPRMMLLSVPYAAKASSADTLAGKPASEFVLSTNLADQVRTAFREDASNGSGDGPVGNAVTLNFLQKGDGIGGTTDSIAFETGGNIGVGTTTPSVRLDVRGTGVNDGGKMGIGNSDGTDFVSFYGGQNNDARSILFWADGNDFSYGTASAVTGAGFSEKMRVSAIGNVGIGTTTPTTKLDVRGSGVNDGGIMGIGNADVSDFISFYSGQNNDARSIMFWSAGNAFAYGTATGVNGVGFTELVRIDASGNLGIGTTTPTAKLHVIGNTTITGNITVDGNIAAKYQDVAEWVDSVEPLEAGTVVIIDETGHNRVKAASSSYDSRVAGAVSPQPGLILGEPGEGKVLVAQSGRVRIKVDTRYGAIKAGDLLVSSPRKGYAMVSKPVRVGSASMHRPGTVLGKALEPLASGAGEVLVLLTLQ